MFNPIGERRLPEIGSSDQFKEKAPTSEFSIEQMEKIFSILDMKDQQFLIAREWKPDDVNKIVAERDKRLNELLDFIVKVLNDNYPDESHEFEMLRAESGQLNFTSVPKIKNNLDRIRTLTVKLLASVDTETLKKIDKFCRGNKRLPLFRFVVKASQILKEYEKVQEMPEDQIRALNPKKINALVEIGKKLMAVGEEDLAMEVYGAMPWKAKCQLVMTILDPLVEMGEMQKALFLSEDWQQEQIWKLNGLMNFIIEIVEEEGSKDLSERYKAILENTQIKRNTDLESIQRDYDDLACLLAKQLADFLSAEKGGYRGIQKLAKYFDEGHDIPVGFEYLVRKIWAHNELERALKITDEYKKSESLGYCVDKLANLGLLEEAVAAAEQITDEGEQSLASRRLAMPLITMAKFESFFGLVDRLREERHPYALGQVGTGFMFLLVRHPEMDVSEIVKQIPEKYCQKVLTELLKEEKLYRNRRWFPKLVDALKEKIA